MKDKKTCFIIVRVSQPAKSEVEEYTDDLGITTSDFVRELIEKFFNEKTTKQKG